MRFSCARCGQRYSSVDEPRTGFEYRVPCVACGAVVVLRGADFPALPTAAPGPAFAADRAAVSDATGEEPLGLALGPLVLQERAAFQRGSAPRASSRAAASSSSRWPRIAAGGGVALATAGAAFLLLFGGPGSGSRSAATPDGTPPTRLHDGAAPPDVGTSASAVQVASAAPPGTPAPQGGPPTAPKAAPSTPGPPPVPASAPKRAAPPPARRVASAPGPGPAGAAAAAPPPATGAAALAPYPPSAHPPPDQMVADALTARRPAFEACARAWMRDEPGSGLFGRRVTVSLVVNPSGAVSSPTIDDPAVEASALGACLRNVVSRPFPAFEGEPLQVVVPLRLGE